MAIVGHPSSWVAGPQAARPPGRYHGFWSFPPRGAPGRYCAILGAWTASMTRRVARTRHSSRRRPIRSPQAWAGATSSRVTARPPAASADGAAAAAARPRSTGDPVDARLYDREGDALRADREPACRRPLPPSRPERRLHHPTSGDLGRGGAPRHVALLLNAPLLFRGTRRGRQRRSRCDKTAACSVDDALRRERCTAVARMNAVRHADQIIEERPRRGARVRRRGGARRR